MRSRWARAAGSADTVGPVDATDDLTAAQRQLRAGGVAPLARDVVRVHGPQAEFLLDGQLSQNLELLAPEEGAWSLLLAPTGKVDAWLRASRISDEEFLLDVDAGWGEAVRARLERFKLRTKATVDLVDDWVALAVRGNVQVELDHAAGQPVLTLPAPWPGLIGWDVLAPAEAHVQLDVPSVPAEALEAVRIEAGVPALGRELTEKTIPAEMGQWFIDASVSFVKGCFVGQELVARIDSRGGNVPRNLRGIVFESDAVPEVGAEVVAGSKPIGTLTSTAFSAALAAPVGLATLPRSVEPPAEVFVLVDGDRVDGEARELPLVDDIAAAEAGAAHETPVEL